jgi:agmatine deiminase
VKPVAARTCPERPCTSPRAGGNLHARREERVIIKPSTPLKDGFAMPAEWEPHAGCWMVWPERTDNWRHGAQPGQAAFAAVAAAIARFEPVTMLASAGQCAAAQALLPAAVRVLAAPSNDAWARDIGASFVRSTDGQALRGVDWRFNAWGGLYAPYDLDDKLAAHMLSLAGVPRYRAPIVLEGGAFHVDGQGTVLTTQACLLDPDRNPGLTRAELESALSHYLGARTVIWLGAGVPADETGGHIDNLACFVRPGTVLLSWCDDPADPHYAVSRDAEERLLAATDAQGRRLTVERIPMPAPMTYGAADVAGLDGAASRMKRAAGGRLAASYVNFYIANGAIIAPAFGTATDAPARAVLARLFARREIVMVPAREILLGGGNIHCITQQQPQILS